VAAAFGILETAEKAGLEGGETGKKKAAAIEKSMAKMKVNDVVKAVSEIKQREVKIAERQEEVKKANLADAVKMRELQAQTKAREDVAEATRQAELAKLKAAREAEDKAESDRLFLKMKAQGEAQIAKALADKGKLEAVEARVAERKRKEEEARGEDVYAPVLREAERILGKLTGTTATSKVALAEEVKALSRKALKPNDRERLRQAALKLGTWYTEWVADQFLPPLSLNKRRTK
jgi:multidrug efflux pump subunit AcrA (membrane-fusion protein)